MPLVSRRGLMMEDFETPSTKASYAMDYSLYVVPASEDRASNCLSS